MENDALIYTWFPFGESSVESIRERAAFTALPGMYALHVWFARRPLVASRSSILCSLLKNKNKNNIFQILGYPINKNIIAIQDEIETNKAKGIRKKENPYTWDRAFKHTPTDSELEWLHTELKKIWGGKLPTVLDPMAGGGSIPFESIRLGLPTIASDLNPVAFLILKATLEYPAKFREKLVPAIEEFCGEIHKRAYEELKEFFPNVENEKILQYLWCRTIRCNKCGLVIPLSPNWWLIKSPQIKDEDHIAVKLKIPKESEGDICSFEIIKNPKKIGYDPSKGTDIGKDAWCPRCPRTITDDVVKKEAQEGRMGHQLYCVSTKKIIGPRKEGRYFRKPENNEIRSIEEAQRKLEIKMPKWMKDNLVPLENYPSSHNDLTPLHYGRKKWTQFFNSRQLLTHLTYVEKFNEVKHEWKKYKKIDDDFMESVIVYGSVVLDSCLDYNSLNSFWDSLRIKIAHTMSIQAFPFYTSYAEANQIGPGKHGIFAWSLEKTISVINEIIQFLPSYDVSNLKVSCQDASMLSPKNKSVECIIVDPPYGENVPYGDVSDFFYVWLKKTVGDLFPKEFKNELSEKDAEAITNPAWYRDAGSAQSRKLADQHYQAKLEACFKEMNRVLKDNGVLTVMFTHRKPTAWAGLTKALLNAGFTFRSSWAVTTEPGKYGKRGKGVLKRTVILACKKRDEEKKGLWSKVKEELYKEAESKVKEYTESGITGPDLLVCTYGPVLGKFGDYSSVRDAAGNIKNPEDALELVAEVVNKFTVNIPGADLETLAYVNLIASFPQQIVDEDEARITVVFGGNLGIHDLVDKGLVKKSGGKITILTSKQRLDEGTIHLAKPEELKSLIDVVHASLIIFEKQGIQAVKKLLEETGKDASNSGLIATLKAISSLGFDMSGKTSITSEIRTASSLLEALGYEPESVLKKGEKLHHFPKGKQKT